MFYVCVCVSVYVCIHACTFRLGGGVEFYLECLP